MAGCCLYGALLMGLFLRKYELVQSFHLSDKVLESDNNAKPDDSPTKTSLPGLDRFEDLRVTGMTCASCAQSVEGSLAGLAGVKRANVDVVQGRVRLVYDGTRTRRDEILRAIEDAGFGATDVGPPTKNAVESLSRRLASWNYGAAFTWSLFCLVPILALEASAGTLIPDRKRELYVLILAGFMQFGFGIPFHRRTWLTLSQRLPMPMDVLVSISTTTAYAASVLFFSQGRRTSYATVAASLISVLSLGKHLESHAKTSVSDTLDAFTRSVPLSARVVTTGTNTTVLPVHMLRDSDIVVVDPGERFPRDGTLCAPLDTAYAEKVEIDESFHTGEACPVVRSTGDLCLAGTLNSGQLPALIRIESSSNATGRLDQVLQALLESQRHKSHLQTSVEKAMAYMVPAVLTLAIASFVGWLLAGTFDDALNSLIATLVVACPCALGLSTPAALMIAVATGSKYGIILKRGAQAVEALANTSTVVFDKTGTLTDGQMQLQRWQRSLLLPENFQPPDRWWQLIHAAEVNSSHWAAMAIAKHMTLNYATSTYESAMQLRREQLSVVPGRGVSCVVDGVAVLVGNEEHLASHGVNNSKLLSVNAASLSPRESCVHVAFDGEYAGTLAFADGVAEQAKATVGELRSRGMTVCMMTGDREAVAAEVARAVGIEQYWSGMTPQAKASQLRAIQRPGTSVAMVGDGVNDAMALGAADVGIAMHCGAPLTVASADLVLLGSSIAGVLSALDMAKAVQGTIKRNIQLAMVYNAVLLPLAMGLLRPVAGFTLHPTLGGALMMASSLSITWSSLRLEKKLVDIFERRRE